MFYYIKNTFENIVKPIDKYVIGENKFTRNSKFSFKDYVTFLCFNKGTSNQADLEDFVEDNFTTDIQQITRQAFSKQRTYIHPIVFKEISKQYLLEINYHKNYDFFKTYKGFRLFGGDGSDFEIPDFEEVRKEFQIKDTEKYRKPAQAKFSSIMDLLNGFILDGIIGNYKQAELPLMHKNIENIQDLITPEKSIFIFDRGYNAMELYANIMSMNSYFIVRLKDRNYIDDRYKITENDSEIQLEITKDRLKKFHNKTLKEKYSKIKHLNLRILTITLENGTTESLLTNILDKNFTIEDFQKLYNLRWGIETNYNTMKNRLNIENYTGKRKITIKQDIYSKFLKYNIFQYYRIYFNLLINRTKRQKGIKQEYKVNQAHLIRKLKKYLPIMILNPTKEIIRKYTKKLIDSCTQSPNKNVKNPTTTRNKKKQRKFNINYKPT
ncbi:MAG: IS4 family transposase [Methanobrevibacter sp.]|uniref:IS4 family transposase n=1 Tax=Methanobrevibacter sp. TaxID=66852 RepID=UPI0025E5BB83|nr:IS4 family transposase [Methanobrevibacter sp.]MBQ8017370.1 IS4 family transposase [Methanobrevibacter sp.]